MKILPNIFKRSGFLILLLTFVQHSHAQPITGVWKGKMGAYQVELKLVRKGDSLIGTSYYYDARSNYRRYSVKGYFDGKTNDVIWWDDVLVESSHPGSSRNQGQNAQLAVADFNCPGEGIMKLDGNSSRKENEQKEKKEVHLVKGNTPVFPDEWDFLIENYAYGVNHPEIVDSIEYLALGPKPIPVPVEPAITAKTSISRNNIPAVEEQIPQSQPDPISTIPVSSQSSEEKFVQRKKILQQVIPIKGDSLEIRFYDNAEIDGDSIAVFLNGRMLREHILLSENAFTMKIALTDLDQDNELVMVAENLGTIPPNTSLMVAIVEEKRYEAHLQSTEGSSALVRLVKP